jgi:hypothetical protein
LSLKLNQQLHMYCHLAILPNPKGAYFCRC